MIKINKKKFILFILKEDIFLVCREIMIKKKKFFNLDIIGEKIIYKKKKLRFLIIQNLIQGVILISHILLFYTKIIIYYQLDKEIDS